MDVNSGADALGKSHLLMTTALTALILYVVGTESVQGFAITLLIGLVASMVTAVFVTRTIFMTWLNKFSPTRLSI